MNRTTLIISFVLALFALPSVTSAQSPTLAKETVLFGFDGGNYDGWTLTGDCFDKQPATAKTFVDRQGNPLVSGIVGTGYLTTLFKNAATTGKAVSKDFPIDKPFLTFRIGGGNYPKEACLNLIVDGKIVRTETGNDSAELRPAYWDVYALMGKTAHLEVVDATPNPNRGYIMLDDLRLTERSQLRPQRVLEQMKISPYFLGYSSFYENKDEQKKGHWLCFGVTEYQFDSMVDDVWLKMCNKRNKPYPNITIEQIAKYVMEVVSGTEQKGEREFTAPLTELGHQWLLAEGVCAWCLIYIKFDQELVDASARGEKVDTVNSQYPDIVLRNSPPKACCSGHSLILRDVSRKLGLTCHILQGRLRGFWGSKEPGGHQWDVFTFPGGLKIPADPTTIGEREDVLKYGGKIRAYANLPRRREEWELYHALYYNWNPIPKNIVLYGDPSQSVDLLNLSEAQWLAIDIFERNRATYLPLFEGLVRHR